MYRNTQMCLRRMLIACLVCCAAADLHQDLIDASWKGDVQAVTNLLDKGADINGLNPDDKSDSQYNKYTPLVNAVSSASTAVVKLLLDKGADPMVDNAGWIALRFAEKEAKCKDCMPIDMAAHKAIVKLLESAMGKKGCVLPFKYAGVLYNGCSTAGGGRGTTSAWCATAVDANGAFVTGSGNWQKCPAGVKVDDGKTGHAFNSDGSLRGSTQSQDGFAAIAAVCALGVVLAAALLVLKNRNNPNSASVTTVPTVAHL